MLPAAITYQYRDRRSPPPGPASRDTRRGGGTLVFSTDGLSHGEIIVVSGLFAFGIMLISSVIGATVAYLATREWSPATVREAVLSPAVEAPAFATPAAA
jgi:hypothetical protein